MDPRFHGGDGFLWVIYCLNIIHPSVIPAQAGIHNAVCRGLDWFYYRRWIVPC